MNQLTAQEQEILNTIAPYFAEELAKGKSEEEALAHAFGRQLDFLDAMQSPEVKQLVFERYCQRMGVRE